MSYKTGGFKTKYIEAYGPYSTTYTIYCALESVSDVEVYKMFDEKGNEKDITISSVNDSSNGKYCLIDCLYALKHLGTGSHRFGNSDFSNVVVEDMTKEEMNKYFGG